jgi:RimJ/RimL family protein N-acetyltransferase
MVRVSGADVDALARHTVEHMAESGREGSPHFAVSKAWVLDEVRSNMVARFAKDLDEPLWGRAWSLLSPGGVEVVGHLELRGGRVPSEMHRATLGMGIMRAFTGQGHGRRLLEIAVKWARDTAELDWIDLGVFSGNAPARKLYARMGFVEIGQRDDAFRIEGGAVIDDVQMALKLR